MSEEEEEEEEEDQEVRFLEDQLESIRQRFEHGDLHAFGVNQEKILKEMQDIRQLQAQLSLKQVSMLAETMAQNKEAHEKAQLSGGNVENDDTFSATKEKEEAMGVLTQMLDSICNSISKTSQMTPKLRTTDSRREKQKQ